MVGGVATITLGRLVVETFEVAFSNDAGLTNPPNDSLDVTLGVGVPSLTPFGFILLSVLLLATGMGSRVGRAHRLGGRPQSRGWGHGSSRRV